mmetsp:Transcript_3476/g.5025  ORF Transcript_3476/g.5025 Transcript_3476/m.5025 type:complete len:831 (+) Transcript_3476:383-2875(+)|eukprot:CAMPEP_0203788950 /NCGR_PEP_ID=MMETSP0100_2-20121128/3144_1 /ASSEMBLY_ACC=CAM_ASM_000210 /TAXON_ID=96639 /ORGANISM=" , Strain NY0313808BC1" /LENGTH=830 /DNA_ID=CAMNT_0050691775 /DNA_START=349 /DNA_END=2841 /DNA_ORIENTATION=-
MFGITGPYWGRAGGIYVHRVCLLLGISVVFRGGFTCNGHSAEDRYLSICHPPNETVVFDFERGVYIDLCLGDQSVLKYIKSFHINIRMERHGEQIHAERIRLVKELKVLWRNKQAFLPYIATCRGLPGESLGVTVQGRDKNNLTLVSSQPLIVTLEKAFVKLGVVNGVSSGNTVYVVSGDIKLDVQLPDTFKLGKDGRLVLFSSASSKPFVFTSPSKPAFNLIIKGGQVGQQIVFFAVLVATDKGERETNSVIAKSDTFRVEVVSNLTEGGKSSSSFTKISSWRYGSHFMHPANDQYIGQAIVHYGEWSRHEVDVFKYIIDIVSEGSRPVVVDVGSSFGTFAIPLALHISSRSGTVFAIEGDLRIYNQLRGNIALAGLENTIKTFNVVAGGSDGPLPQSRASTECLADNFGGTSFDSTSASFHDAWWPLDGKSSPVHQATLDALLEPHDLEHIHFIKLDVEGMETESLRGLRKNMIVHRPVLYLEGDRPSKHKSLCALLEAESYLLYWSVYPLYHPENFAKNRKDLFPGLVSINILAIPSEKRSLFPPDSELFKNKVDPGFHPYNKIDQFMEFVRGLGDSELKIYSQNGEDGIIIMLFNFFGVTNKLFVEVGTGDGHERNTRVLQSHMGWTGLLLDVGFEDTSINLYKEFVTAENIVEVLIKKYEMSRAPDFFSLDIDFNDFWVLSAALCGSLSTSECPSGLVPFVERDFAPRVVVFELNSKLGFVESLVVPYDPARLWDGTSFHGASIKAFNDLARRAGYTLFYCERNGVNCFLVRDDLISRDVLAPSQRQELEALLSVEQVYKPPRYFGYQGWSHDDPIEQDAAFQSI